MTLTEMTPGQTVEITGYAAGNAAYRAKLLALGLTRGIEVHVLPSTTTFEELASRA